MTETIEQRENTLEIKLEKAIEFLTYGMVLLFYTGRLFEPFVFLIDGIFLFLLYVRRDRAFIKDNRQVLVWFSILFGYFIVQSFFVEFSMVALQNALGMIRFIILPFALYYVFNTNQKILKLIYTIFISVSLLMADSIYQYFNGNDIFGHPVEVLKHRLTAWSSTPKVGESLGLFVGMVVASFFVVKQKYIPILVLLMLFTVMLISGNRGPIVYVFGAMGIVMLFSRYRIHLISVVSVVFVVAATLFIVSPNLFKEFQVYKNPFVSKNNSGRTTIYKAGVAMIKEHPLIGVGSKNFRYEFWEYYQKVYDPKRDTGEWDKIYATLVPLHVHSMFLSLLINWGLIGSIIFLYTLYLLYKKYIFHHELALLASISFIYTVFPLNFGKSIAQSQWQFFIFLTLAFAMIMSRYKTRGVQQ